MNRQPPRRRRRLDQRAVTARIQRIRLPKLGRRGSGRITKALLRFGWFPLLDYTVTLPWY